MKFSKRQATVVLAAALLSMSGAVLAQGAFPSKPIRLVVPYAAGGGTDILARQLAKQASEYLGQNILVDNKPGAGTTMGAGEVARAAADGYTLLWGDSATFAVNPHMYKKLPYHPQQSFTPVTLTVKGALVLVANKTHGIKSVPELIAYAKSHPGKLSYGTPGNATPHHLAMEQLKLQAGVSIQHVPYKGEAPAMQDLVGGNLDVMFAGARIVKPQEQSGRVTVLAVAGGKRNVAMPGVQTVAEAGLKGYASEYWHGVVAPAGTPAEVVNKLNDAFVRAMRAPEVVNWLLTGGSGIEWTGSTPAEMEAHITREMQAAGELVKAIGLTMD